MFRVQNLVPEVYPNQSRDFQLFCRLYDVAFNSVKRSIDSMNNCSCTEKCDARLLPLLQTKVGFFSDSEISDKDLRKILSAFPHIIRYKGSRRSLQFIVNLYSRLTASSSETIHVRPVDSSYLIEVFSDSPIQKTSLLVDLLKYVVPAGYTVDYYKTNIVNIKHQFSISSQLRIEQHCYVSRVVIRKTEMSLSDIINMAGVSYIDTSETQEEV